MRLIDHILDCLCPRRMIRSMDVRPFRDSRTGSVAILGVSYDGTRTRQRTSGICEPFPSSTRRAGAAWGTVRRLKATAPNDGGYD